MGKRSNSKKPATKSSTSSVTKKTETPARSPSPSESVSPYEGLWKWIAGAACTGFLGLLSFYVVPQLAKIEQHESTLNALYNHPQLKSIFETHSSMTVRRSLEKADAANKSLKSLCDAIVAEAKRLPKDFAAVTACKEISTVAQNLLVENELPRRAESSGELATVPTLPEPDLKGQMKPAPEVHSVRPQRKFPALRKKPRNPNTEDSRFPAQN